METSRKCVTQCWFRIFGLLLIVAIIGLLGTVLSLGIGAIWIVPLILLTLGIAYRNLFGYEGEVA